MQRQQHPGEGRLFAVARRGGGGEQPQGAPRVAVHGVEQGGADVAVAALLQQQAEGVVGGQFGGPARDVPVSVGSVGAVERVLQQGPDGGTEPVRDGGEQREFPAVPAESRSFADEGDLLRPVQGEKEHAPQGGVVRYRAVAALVDPGMLIGYQVGDHDAALDAVPEAGEGLDGPPSGLLVDRREQFPDTGGGLPHVVGLVIGHPPQRRVVPLRTCLLVMGVDTSQLHDGTGGERQAVFGHAGVDEHVHHRVVPADGDLHGGSERRGPALPVGPALLHQLRVAAGGGEHLLAPGRLLRVAADGLLHRVLGRLRGGPGRGQGPQPGGGHLEAVLVGDFLVHGAVPPRHPLHGDLMSSCRSR
ncbi:hypothetical protein QMA61_04750 [Streptomyces coelicoflavus]|uniref:hypothetical protein n=1 Tax=Streptomyces coelicoflavus TaxID=285562 RepID=UPI0024AD2601|nr:hypothetical protein [Streptomyces coelicoflavus]MDI6515495.1 hypothetical protein [Streptomyces coelicoflavus]